MTNSAVADHGRTGAAESVSQERTALLSLRRALDGHRPADQSSRIAESHRSHEMTRRQEGVKTNSYDLGRLGTWQRLVALVETTPNTAGGHLAIEKGALEGSITATIRLDDVRLELLESP